MAGYTKHRSGKISKPGSTSGSLKRERTLRKKDNMAMNREMKLKVKPLSITDTPTRSTKFKPSATRNSYTISTTGNNKKKRY